MAGDRGIKANKNQSNQKGKKKERGGGRKKSEQKHLVLAGKQAAQASHPTYLLPLSVVDC